MNIALPYQDVQTVCYALAAVVFPFAAFVINFLFLGKRKLSGQVSTVFVFISTILSVVVFTRVWDVQEIHVRHLWFTIGNNDLYAGILLNNLSVLMLGLVSVIALPVHIYSMAYMKDDAGYSRYFQYLSFFCFSMLALVVMDNLLLLYAFWELVGFSSYLLIGFWFDRAAAVEANKKAFIINRIGDIGLLTAIIILFNQYHTFDIVQLFKDGGLIAGSVVKNGLWISTITQTPVAWQYVASIGIFLGVAAKSAQFPLHTWLPDAMEGPTSVSALIHAATMVAAGVFLLGRVYPLFNEAELTTLAVIGCFTAFMTATIALTQNDLKRILAYSTISQLGYMVMAMGIGAYAASLFHLVTHAFFKCLLFLAAGIVIHQIKRIKEDNDLDIDPRDIANMGGLRKKLPLTFIAAVIGGLALIGLPLTSGYLSKEGILVQAFEWADHKGSAYMLLPVLASITSWLTAFYVARLILKVFYGDMNLLRLHPGITIHIGDGGWHYKLPLVILSICCLFPLFSLNPLSHNHSWLLYGLSTDKSYSPGTFEIIVPVVVNVLSLVVIYYAYSIYIKQRTVVSSKKGFLYLISFNEWYIDSFYSRVVVRFILLLSDTAFWIDRNVIDGFVNVLAATGVFIAGTASWCDRYIVDGILHLSAAIVQAIGGFARRFQNGKVQYYLFSMLLAVIVVFILKILIWN